jgi:hypothetical protein
MARHRSLLAGAGLAALAFVTGCGGGEGVSLGDDGTLSDGDGRGKPSGPGGSGRETISSDELVALLRADFEAQGSPPGARYISLHAFYDDASFSDDQVRAAADAVSKLANHLATRQREIKRPVPVAVGDGPPIALRFAAGDHDLSDDDWALIERGGGVLPRAAGCAVPVIGAEQFLGSASSNNAFEALFDQFESVYSNIVLRRQLVDRQLLAPDQLLFQPVDPQTFVTNGFTMIGGPATFYEVADALGVDLQLETLQSDEAEYDVARGCVRASPETGGPRCVQRHGRAAGGSLWWTMDTFDVQPSDLKNPFASPIGPLNPPSDPVVSLPYGFLSDGGEARFTLPNGLVGAAFFNANFALISSVSYVDEMRPPEPPSSLSLFGQLDYIRPVRDELRPLVEANMGAFSIDEVGFVFQVVAAQERLDQLVAQDRGAYDAALAGTFYGAPPADGAAPFFNFYAADLSPSRLQAALGMTSDEFDALLRAHPSLQTALPPIPQDPSADFISREAFTVFSSTLRDLVAPPAESILNACVVQR